MTREICEAQMPENDVKLSDLKESRKAPEVNTAEIHVLAVDDSVTDRKVIERLLKISSFKVTTVDSGSRALEILGVGGCHGSVNINQISMIITDYCMPGMSGYDLLKRVKETSALKEIPVVIMSSENVPNRIERCLEEGAKEFILKPVRLADVKRLRDHVSEPRQDLVDQPSIPCNKRKFSPEGFQASSSERRPRLNGLTVA